ncbi:MAG TPA: TlpA disulfide reductase family protein [Gemmatales bacterium]|nr:TlpA disulfide reductase family protein [Gemmatales bacterium]
MLILLSAVAAMTTFVTPDTKALPRYQFKVGQEIKYRSQSEFLYGKGDTKSTLGNRGELTAWVIRNNPDGGWRIIVQSETFSWQTQGKNDKKNERSDGKTLAYFDISPDGTIPHNDSFGYRFNPSTYFPKLPASDVKSWEVADDAEGDKIRCTTVASEKPGEFVFDAVRESPMDKIYLSSSSSQLVFDIATGMIVRGTTKNTQGYGFEGQGTGTIEMTGIQMRGEDFLKPLTIEAEAYFAAEKRYQELSKLAAKSGDKAKDLFADAEKAIKDAQGIVKIDAIKEQLESKLKSHTQYVKYSIEDAERKAKIVGKPSAEWKTTDLAGKEFSNESLKGKVVVMDFWYRGCGWCIKAMPQMNQLADDFKNDNVVIIGMNTDRDEKDAKFVIDAMKLNYNTLKGEGLPTKFGVQGFPTLVIIDKEGNVHDLHVGYSKTLREEVGKTIRELLAKK